MYYIFISHSWKYSNAYESIVKFLDRELGENNWKDYSVPQNDPVHTNGTDRELYEAIERKIKCCSCVIILAAMYSTYSKWINKEVEIARKWGKPIIAVKPWGAEKVSTAVTNAADKVVGWNGYSIAEAVKEVCE